MINFERNQIQPLLIGQEEPINLWWCQFWSRWVGYGIGPPQLVLLVLVAAAIAATYVTTFSFMLAGELGTLAPQVFITSALVTCFTLAPRWGLYDLLIALFSCLWIQGAILIYLSTLPVVRWWLICLHEVHSGLHTHEHVLPSLWVHTLVHNICSFGVWFG